MPESRALVMGMNAQGLITDWMLLCQAVCMVGVVLAAFLFGGMLHLEPATIALAGGRVDAAGQLATSRRQARAEPL